MPLKSHTTQTARQRPRLVSILVVGGLLAGCAAPRAADPTDDLFDQFEIVTGNAAGRPTILSGFFLGGATAEVAVLGVGGNGEPRLRMYGLPSEDDRTWAPVLEATLRPAVLFVDVANVGGRDRLITYESGRVNWFDPDSKTERVLVDVPFDADGVYSHTFEFSDTGAFALLLGLRKNVERTFLISLRDMNGDGVTDLVTLTLSGRSPFKQRSVYEVHFGASTPDGVVFSRDANTAIHPRGKAGGGQLWGYASRSFDDFDGDGQVDLMLRDINIGLGGMIRAITAKSVGIDLEFFRMDRGVYPDKPSFVHKIRTGAAVSGENVPFLPAVLVGDVNGDGRSDLVAGGKTREALNVFIGVPGPDVFAPKPRRVAVKMPGDGERTWLKDLNEDGKQDIVMHHASPTEPHRLTILIAR